METILSSWHHSPPHVFQANTNYMVTAGTYGKEHFFIANEKLKLLERLIFESLATYKWIPISWAIMSNHYHLILRSPEKDSQNLKNMIKSIHAKSANWPW
jgi:putative transposase